MTLPERHLQLLRDMNYQGTLETGEQITIGSHEAQTRVQVQSGDDSQHESQGTSFATGQWKSKPRVFQTENGAVLEIDGEREPISLELKEGRLRRLDEKPQLKDATAVSLKEVDEFPNSELLQPMEPMKPMEPLEPLKPMS